MNKLIVYLLILVVSIAFYPGRLIANTETQTDPKNLNVELKSAEPKELIQRLNEIKEMNISSLSSLEKQELRSEVLLIKNQLNEKGGIYISVIGIIIILLLIIILF